MAEAKSSVNTFGMKKKRTLTCPWCNNEMSNAHAIGGTVKFSCENCKLDGFITRLPPGISAQEFQSLKTIA